MKVTNKQHTRKKKKTRQKTKKTQTRKLNMFLYWKCKGSFMRLGGVFLSLWLSPPWAQIYSYRGTWRERIETGLSLPSSRASSLPWAHWNATAWAEDSFHKDGLLAIYSVSFQEIPKFSPLGVCLLSTIVLLTQAGCSKVALRTCSKLWVKRGKEPWRWLRKSEKSPRFFQFVLPSLQPPPHLGPLFLWVSTCGWLVKQ